MHMRSLHRNRAVRNPPTGQAGPYDAPRFAHAVSTARAHWRPICLVAGALLMVTGLMLPSTVAFIAGMLAVGSSLPGAGLPSATAAKVRVWMQVDKTRAEHRHRWHATGS